VPHRGGGLPQRADVHRRLDERLRDDVHLVLERELQALAVARREGARAQIDAGRLRPLRERSWPPTTIRQTTSRPVTWVTSACHEAVVQKQRVAALHDLGRRSKVTDTRLGSLTSGSVVRVKTVPVVSSVGSSASWPTRIFARAGRP